ncbi:3-isopropylmalate dehydratase small subunit [Pseudomonas sp. FP2300]|uniref:3-isopropylmalate dehydratase small subunit n=1 Tax=Pseudomonas sp. FP2300 TaxID=2954090 RepID=UPI002735376A|nr:3-isopropylmalate dehydratase small subunit [Pseudomonas sp. FP2300]WLH65210.1 3-isopropylmalate dehydratase small subunit [Pseudomonas sp. FP2300]
MKPFVRETSQLALLDRNNVDTDAILPKQFMKSIKRTGFGQHAFDEWRYLDAGVLGIDCSKRPLNQEFELNQPKFVGASILLTRANFGCGSSREHAPWALLEYGFRVIIAQSFAEIFQGNCLKNGILPITLDAETIDRLFEEVRAHDEYRICVDLETGTVKKPDGTQISFSIESSVRQKLLNGWDDIELTLKHAKKIREFEAVRQRDLPWL